MSFHVSHNIELSHVPDRSILQPASTIHETKDWQRYIKSQEEFVHFQGVRYALVTRMHFGRPVPTLQRLQLDLRNTRELKTLSYDTVLRQSTFGLLSEHLIFESYNKDSRALLAWNLHVLICEAPQFCLLTCSNCG